jgi:hypothetical protein
MRRDWDSGFRADGALQEPVRQEKAGGMCRRLFSLARTPSGFDGSSRDTVRKAQIFDN